MTRKPPPSPASWQTIPISSSITTVSYTHLVTDGNINCVIVKDLSRLGREYIETGRYLRRVFPAYGVRLIAMTDSIDTAHDSGDDLTLSVKNIMNEAYCRDISIKTRSSLDVKRRNEMCIRDRRMPPHKKTALW